MADPPLTQHGPIAQWGEISDFNAEHQPWLELRTLGDSPAIGVVMNPGGAIWRDYPRPRFTADCRMIEPFLPSAPTFLGTGIRDLGSDVANRTVRVCESLDTRWLLEDMFHKLARFARLG